MAFQDDERESAMIELFDLYKNDIEGRSGIDAFLDIDGQTLPFELKTTSKGSVTTVRDFGPDHIEKWTHKHWLIGFFINNEEYYLYGSPAAMKPWIDSKAEYIAPDFSLAAHASQKLTLEDLYSIVGEKEVYTEEDAKKLQKKQYSAAQYLALRDNGSGYTPAKMLSILQDRCSYLVQRGSTLNNPHIPFSYFKDWTKITENHADKLRELVRAWSQ